MNNDIMKVVLETFVNQVATQLEYRIESKLEDYRREMAEAYAGRIAELERRVEAMNSPRIDPDHMARHIREQILDYVEPILRDLTYSCLKDNFKIMLEDTARDSDALEDAVSSYLEYSKGGRQLLEDLVKDKMDERIESALDDLVDSLTITR